MSSSLLPSIPTLLFVLLRLLVLWVLLSVLPLVVLPPLAVLDGREPGAVGRDAFTLEELAIELSCSLIHSRALPDEDTILSMPVMDDFILKCPSWVQPPVPVPFAFQAEGCSLVKEGMLARGQKAAELVKRRGRVR